MSHIVIALALQAIVGVLTGNWWAGAALGIGLYVGRENAQAEYRWIERLGKGSRANKPWWGAFDPRVWNAKSIFDVVGPSVAVVTVAVSRAGAFA